MGLETTINDCLENNQKVRTESYTVIISRQQAS